MTKNTRDHRQWTADERWDDLDGWRAARAAYERDKAAAEKRQREEEDYEVFAEEFVRQGGSRVDARAAFKEARNRQAAEAAEKAMRRADEEAMERSRRLTFRNA